MFDHRVFVDKHAAHDSQPMIAFHTFTAFRQQWQPKRGLYIFYKENYLLAITQSESVSSCLTFLEGFHLHC